MEARPLGENAERRDDTTDAKKEARATRPRPPAARRRSTQTPRETLSPSAAAALAAFVGGEDSGRRKTADVETVRALERCLGPSGGDDDRTWAGPALPQDDNDRTATEGEIEALRRTVSQPPQRRQSIAPPKRARARAPTRSCWGAR